MKFKVGQKVYYYQATGEYVGGIVEGYITKAIKDLSTGKVIYTVKTDNCLWAWSSTKDLTAENLYSSYKKIEKEYKNEIVYNNLIKHMNDLERTLDTVYNELTKDEHKDFSGMILNIDGNKAFSTINVKADDINIEGIGSLKEELNKLKKEINKVKKTIKPKTKKPVVDKKSEENK